MSTAITLESARDWLRARASAGDRCPCCNQFVKVYERKLNSGMAAWLVRFYKASRWAPDEYLSKDIVARGSGDWSQLKHWGLLQSHPTEAGFWRVTPHGRMFVLGTANAKSHAVLYDDRCIRLEGDEITIQTALGKKFDYFELMAERPASNEPA